jgi:antitoxin ChpS
MTKVQLEEVNGNVMLVLPRAIVDGLQLAAGSEVEVGVQGKSLVLRTSRRGRYRLEDMLAECDPEAFEQTDADREFLNSPPVGRELI